MGRIVLVCGGRKFGLNDLQQRLYAFRVLDVLHDRKPISLIVHGDASGADRIAKRWAELRGVKAKAHAVDWEDISHPDAVIREHPNGSKYDAAAGNRRNQEMLDEHPDIELVVAFPGGPGTADMCTRARKKGIVIQHEVKCN